MSQNLTDDYQQSNKEVVESIKQAYETQKLKEHNFPTEIIELPSRGLIYSKLGEINGTIINTSRNNVYQL